MQINLRILIMTANNKFLKAIALSTIAFTLLYFEASASFSANAQNISIRGGATTLLYDNRYYPDLWGPKSPRIPSIAVKFGWEEYSGAPAAICNRPEYGIGFDFDPIGIVQAANGPGLGNIYSLFGYFDRPLFRTPKFSFEYSSGFGIGCVFNNLYDPYTNPYNVMISLPVNAHIEIGFQSKFMITDRYFAGLGIYLKHNSNGAVHWENYGYNGIEAALTVGMKDFRQSTPRPYQKVSDKRHFDVDFKPSFIYNLHVTGGVMSVEALFENTLKKYGEGVNLMKIKYGIHGDVMYKYRRTQATGIGLDLFFTPFCDIIAENDGKGNDSNDPVSVGISIVQEMRYRDLSAMIGLGRYIYDNDGLAPNKILYQMVNIRYHFPELFNTYAGIVLKAHKFMAAESIQISLGKSF